MARVMVTDGDARSSLAVVRSLGRAGHEVFVVADHLPALATVSRFSAGSALIPSFLSNQVAAVAALSEQAATWSIDLVLPMTDHTLTAVLADSTAFRTGRASLIAPSRAAFDTIADKGSLQQRAERLGVGAPRSAVAQTPADLSGAAAGIGFPCVVKPVRSAQSSGGQLVRFPVRYAEDAGALSGLLPAAAFPVLVQEIIVGAGEGIFVLARHGELRAVFSHRRLREKPPSGGVSTYRESIRPPADLLAWSRALIRDLEWDGVAMLEFKRRAATGEAYLIEVNGRFWGSLQLGIDAGVDFPRLLIDQALGKHAEGPNDYKVGVRSRWEWGDVDQLISRLRGATVGDRPDNIAGRIGAIFEFLRVRASERWEVFDRGDLQPFLTETGQWFHQLRGGKSGS